MALTMIDWITALVPCFHEPIAGGRVLKLTPTGEIVWEVDTGMDVSGSYDANIRLKTHGLDIVPDDSGAGIFRGGSILEISGNPTKWLQGHNLWGDFSSPGPLIEFFMFRLCELLPSLHPTDLDRRRWQDFSFELRRIDLTRMFCLNNRSDVRSWLRVASETAYLKHRGRGSLTKNGTLYFGKHSRRWSLKFYCKGDELEAGKDHGLPTDIPERAGLLAFADRALRSEVVIRSMELKRRKLNWACAWDENTGSELLAGIAEGLNMSEQRSIPSDALENLSSRLRMAYETWLVGHDLREILSTRTFYRYRKELLPLGIDLASRQPHHETNVVPLIRVLEAIPVGPPDWAKGTSLLVGPSDLIDARRRFRERQAA